MEPTWVSAWPPQERFWEQHTAMIWLLDMGVLTTLSLFYRGFPAIENPHAAVG